MNIYRKDSTKPLAVYRHAYGKKMAISTKGGLKRGTWYTVKVSTGVHDGANKLQKPKTWHFKTKG